MQTTQSTMKKIIFASLIGLLFISCGKDLREPASDDVIHTPITSADIELEVNHIDTISGFTAVNNGFLRIPKKIDLVEGEHDNRVIYISYNVSNNTAEFYCVYLGFGDSFSFEDCYDLEQNALGLRPGDLVPQAMRHSVEMELENNETNAFVRAKVLLNFDGR